MPAAPLKSFLPSLFAATFLLLGTPSLRAQQIIASIPADNAALPSAAAASPAPHQAAARPPLIVIGFAGGFIHRTNSIHGEIALALHLSKQYGARIQSEIFENHHGEEAHREILRLLHLSDSSTDNSKGLSSLAGGDESTERTALFSSPPATPLPIIILYGHSWGASEAVDVARQLERDGIPVHLLVAVDGVRKHNHDDAIIPPNVAQAINFYQTEGLLHGRPTISAEDPASTQILDNIHLTYRKNPVPTPNYPWFARTFMHRHIEIENDPRVWNRVEAMISANLPPA
jgi:hypothetical protein